LLQISPMPVFALMYRNLPPSTKIALLPNGTIVVDINELLLAALYSYCAERAPSERRAKRCAFLMKDERNE